MSNANATFLKEHPVFCRLSDHYRNLLSQHMDVISLDPGETLIQEGDPADFFYIVMHGTVDLYADVAGDEEQWVQRIDVQGVIGWSWLVPPYRWAFSARTPEGGMMMRFDAKAIRDLCERDPAFGYGTMKQICTLMLDRLHTVRNQMSQRIRELEG
jgi:CRP/FNR family transcriptional regulator, cyclic AMP receptor protein